MKLVERNVCWRFVWNVSSFRIVIVTWKWRKKIGLLEFGYTKVVKRGCWACNVTLEKSTSRSSIKSFNHFDGSIITAERCFDNFSESTSINFDCHSKHIATVRFNKVVVEFVKITTVGDRHSDLLPTNRFWFPFIRPKFKLRSLCRRRKRTSIVVKAETFHRH